MRPTYYPDPAENARLGIEFVAGCDPKCDEFHLSSLLRRAFLPYDQHIGDHHTFTRSITEIMEKLRLKHPIVRVVIAGSTDNGLYCMLLEAARRLGGDEFVRSLDITIVDRCKLPLDICDRLATKYKLSPATIQSGFLEFNPAENFDLLIAHGVISFFPDHKRNQYMSHMCSWLSANGKMISSTQYGGRIANDHDSIRLQGAEANLDRLIDNFANIGPELRTTLIKKLRRGIISRSRHPDLFGDRSEALSFYQGAGFKVDNFDIVENDNPTGEGPKRRFRARAIATCSRAED